MLLQLRCGADSFGASQSALSPEEEALMREREAEWNQWGEEWNYCLVPDEDGIGRVINQDPEPYNAPDDSGGPEILNLDGQHPGPDVWQNPPAKLRALGWVIDPATAPAPLVIEHGLRYLDQQRQKIMDERKYGPDISHYNIPTPEELGPHNPPHLYWDRDGGTRPFVNLRDQLAPGWR